MSKLNSRNKHRKELKRKAKRAIVSKYKMRITKKNISSKKGVAHSPQSDSNKYNIQNTEFNKSAWNRNG